MLRQFLMRIWLWGHVSMKRLQSSFPVPTIIPTCTQIIKSRVQICRATCQFFSFQVLHRAPTEKHWREAGGELRCFHPVQEAQKSILQHFVRLDLYSGTEERAIDWQKVFITQAARRQQWKDQGLLKQDTAVPRELDPGQQALAKNSSHAIAVLFCGWLPKSQLKVVNCSAPPHMISQADKCRREQWKSN